MASEEISADLFREGDNGMSNMPYLCDHLMW